MSKKINEQGFNSVLDARKRETTSLYKKLIIIYYFAHVAKKVNSSASCQKRPEIKSGRENKEKENYLLKKTQK